MWSKLFLCLRATLLTEQSFCMSPGSSQLGGVAWGVEGGDGRWMADKVHTWALLSKASWSFKRDT